MRYPTERLGDHIQVLSGFAFKSKDFSDEGIPVIKIKNITPPSVSLIDLSYVPEEIADKNEKFILQYDDVLIALTGSHINQMASVVGRVAKVRYNEKTVLNQRVGKITVNDADDCDLDFVYYYLSQDQVKIELASKAGGAANQANISPTDIKNLLIPFPEIAVQRKISSMLRTYDDLIENNQKQIKLLEEAAQRLYKEWFVDLRFPGYENTPIVDGVPGGWTHAVVTDLLDIKYGKDHKSLPDGDIPVYGSGGIMRKVNKILHSGESVLIPRKGSLNNILLVSGDFWTIDTMFFSIPKQENVAKYVYLFLCGVDMYAMNIGAAVPSMTVKILDGMKLLYPNAEILAQFENIVSSYFSMIDLLRKQIGLLTEARDMLLPKLMNGEIEV